MPLILPDKSEVPLPDGVDVGQVSDGYHTFDVLYQHRCLLFIGLAHSHRALGWKSLQHTDGSMFPGWFIAGMALPTGDITYHLPLHLWQELDVRQLMTAPIWDGHTAEDTLQRLLDYVRAL